MMSESIFPVVLGAVVAAIALALAVLIANAPGHEPRH